MRSSPRSKVAAAALATALSLGAAACTKEDDTPASPATTASPNSSGQGSNEQTGQGQSNP